MRNVTIVESNVEPNKEHLWFYKGELKWFSPNGWEGVNKSSPTISPTSTKPLIAYIIFKSDAVSNAVINGERIPMNTPKAVIIDYYYSLTALTVPGRKFIGFYENEVKISSAEIIRYHVLPGVHNIELRYKRENEDVDSTTTSTPEPDPSATTTSTTSTSTIYLKNSIRFTNKTNADIGVAGAMSNNGSTISPPILPNQTHLLGQVQDDFELYAYYNQVQFNSLNIKAFKDGVLVLEEVPYVFNSNTNSYTISFKNLVDKEVTDVIINGDIPAQPATTTTTTTSSTTSTTPIPNSIKFTNNTDASLTLTRVNSVDEGLQFPPIQPNHSTSLVHNANDANTDSYIEIHTASDASLPFSFLEITAFKDGGQGYNVPYEHYQDAMEWHYYKFSFKELIEKGFTLVSINGNISTPTTTTSSTTTSSSTPAPITEQQILVSNVFIGEDGPTLSITMDNNINFNNVVPSRLHSLSPNASGIYVTYTPSSRYLAVVSPKTNGFKDTIVATILVPVDGSFEYESHTLYPINSMDNESSKYFLFDLSKSPYVGTAAYSNPCVELHNYNSHSISSIPPFIDGNIPPFADEE